MHYWSLSLKFTIYIHFVINKSSLEDYSLLAIT